MVVNGVGEIPYLLLLLGGPYLSFVGRGPQRFGIGFVTPISHARRPGRQRVHHVPDRLLGTLSEQLSQELSSFAAIIRKVPSSPFRVFPQGFLGREYLSHSNSAAAGIDHIHYVEVAAMQTLWLQSVERYIATRHKPYSHAIFVGCEALLNSYECAQRLLR